MTGERIDVFEDLFRDYPWWTSHTSIKLPKNFVGDGYSSHVFQGELRGIPRVAIKIFKPQVLNPSIEEHRKAFVHEVDTWWKLKDHRNVCPLFGAGVTTWSWDGMERVCFFTASPFLRNGDCSRYIRTSPNVDKIRL
ncbi:hypothetical protein HDU93_006757, partial [Gonapodya sp. JEL0774]